MKRRSSDDVFPTEPLLQVMVRDEPVLTDESNPGNHAVDESTGEEGTETQLNQPDLRTDQSPECESGTCTTQSLSSELSALSRMVVEEGNERKPDERDTKSAQTELLQHEPKPSTSRACQPSFANEIEDGESFDTDMKETPQLKIFREWFELMMSGEQVPPPPMWKPKDHVNFSEFSLYETSHRGMGGEPSASTSREGTSSQRKRRSDADEPSKTTETGEISTKLSRRDKSPERRS